MYQHFSIAKNLQNYFLNRTKTYWHPPLCLNALFLLNVDVDFLGNRVNYDEVGSNQVTMTLMMVLRLVV